MGSEAYVNEGRSRVQGALDEMRHLLFQRKLALFIGEQISSLRGPFTDWWELVGNNMKVS